MNPARRCVLLAAVGVLISDQAPARQPGTEVASELPGARLQGSGTLRYFGMLIYDARLWSAGVDLASDWPTTPFALELEYARELKGELIAERSLAEMRRQGALVPATEQRWLEAMKQRFPDVKAGDRITGVHRPGLGARFFVNGQPRGAALDDEFARRFFGIWLAPQTSEPGLRKALLGGTP